MSGIPLKIAHCVTPYNLDKLDSMYELAYLELKIEENAAKYNGKMIIKNANTVKCGLERHRKNPKSCAVIRPNGDIRIDGMAPFVVGGILVLYGKDDFVSKLMSFSATFDAKKVKKIGLFLYVIFV